jgi:hypothetical protein
MLLSLGRDVLFGMVAALAAAAGGAAGLAPRHAAAQPQPTLALSPSSGPCDAAIEVSGTGFPVPSGPLSAVVLYLLQPGSADVNAGSLDSVAIDRDGTFSRWVTPWKRGCEAAALDSNSPKPSGHFVIAATLLPSHPLQAGERIPNILAVAQYAYTTTAIHVPTEALSISPARGPCDGTVAITGSGFEPGTEVQLKLGRPGSDGTLGTLASAVAGADGGFVVGFALGELGCEAAQLNIAFGGAARPLVGIGAYPTVYPTPVLGGIPATLATVSYAYTTAEAGGGHAVSALPNTGSGPSGQSAPVPWVPVAGGVAALAVVVMAASLYARRARS